MAQRPKQPSENPKGENVRPTHEKLTELIRQVEDPLAGALPDDDQAGVTRPRRRVQGSVSDWFANINLSESPKLRKAVYAMAVVGALTTASFLYSAGSWVFGGSSDAPNRTAAVDKGNLNDRLDDSPHRPFTDPRKYDGRHVVALDGARFMYFFEDKRLEKQFRIDFPELVTSQWQLRLRPVRYWLLSEMSNMSTESDGNVTSGASPGDGGNNRIGWDEYQAFKDAFMADYVEKVLQYAPRIVRDRRVWSRLKRR